MTGTRRHRLADGEGAQQGDGEGAEAAPPGKRTLTDNLRAPDPVDAALGRAGEGTPHAGAMLHDDPTAHAAAATLGARAFSAGPDIYFGAGQRSAPDGDRLLEHEQRHVAQTAGLAPPTPGAWRVSDPGDAAEHDARGGAGADAPLAAAAPGTIHREVVAHRTNQFDEQLRVAAGSGDRREVKRQWKAIAAADRARISVETLAAAVAVAGDYGVTMMKERGVDFSASPLLLEAVLLGDPSKLAAALQAQGLWQSLISDAPRRQAVTDTQARGLDGLIAKADDTHVPQLFEKVYPTLQGAQTFTVTEGSTSKSVVALAWSSANIRRLYSTLAQGLPVDHVQTIRGGFYLVDSYGGSKLTYAAFDPSSHRMYLPAVSAAATGEAQYQHGAAGGAQSGVDAAGTAADRMSHFAESALHEVGHGVYEATNQADWTIKYGNWTTLSDPDAWSAPLWSDALVLAPSGTPLFSPNTARLWLANAIAGSRMTLPGLTLQQIENEIEFRYGGQPLYRYWESFRRQGQEDYLWPSYAPTNNVAGDKVHVWLSRNKGSFTTYDKKLFSTKVSWYSLASPAEWFAEQYAQFHRGAKGMDGVVVWKMKELETMQASAAGALSQPAEATAARDQAIASSAGAMALQRAGVQW